MGAKSSDLRDPTGLSTMWSSNVGLLDRFQWIDLASAVAELQGRGTRVPKLIEVSEHTAIFAQTDERNDVLKGGLSWPVEVKNGKVNLHELFEALKRLGWAGAWA